MDLTDKIESEKICNKLDLGGVHADGWEVCFPYCLKVITPKVAIDFADWLATNYQKIPPLHSKVNHTWAKDHKLRTIIKERFTTEHLFQEFLKDYEYGDQD